MIQATKLIDGEPVAVEAGQVARVHSRKDGRGRLFAELHFVGIRKPLAVVERYDQIIALLAGAGVKTIEPGGEAAAREGGYQPQGQRPLNPPTPKPPRGGTAIQPPQTGGAGES